MRILFAAFLLGVFTLVASVPGAMTFGQAGETIAHAASSGDGLTPADATMTSADNGCCSMPDAEKASGVQHCDLNCTFALESAAPLVGEFRQAAVAAPYRIAVREAFYRWLRPPIAA